MTFSTHRFARRTPAFALALSALSTFNVSASTFISELHYDNSGTDINEAIEITSELTTDLSSYSLVLYNGANGLAYNTIALSGFPTSAEGCGDDGGASVVNFPSNGIQNGSPDGIALVEGDTVIEFISYEGEFTAEDGPAAGLTSIDIEVAETSSTLSTESLQLVNGAWAAPSDHSFGVCTTVVDSTAPSYPDLYISEFHYDNAGADSGEAIEISGPDGASADGFSLVLYNGSNGTVYASRDLGGELEAEEGCEEGTLTTFISGIQNGSPDGIALVNPEGEVLEFISYEGTLLAVDGPAVGLESNDIGVSEASDTPIGHSLQKVDGTWQSPTESHFDSCPSTDIGIETVFIHQIQGTGDEVVSRDVFAVEAIVTADYQADAQLSGFFIQEEDADQDADPTTSEGIFVYCGGCSVDVNVGDQVRVTGFANDFFGMSQLTATFASDIEVLNTGQAIPIATSVSLPLSVSATDPTAAKTEINAFMESVEGMLVTIPQTLTVAEYFQLGRYGQLVLSANGRPRQFTDADLPSEAGFAAHQIDLAAGRIILDDENNSQNSALFDGTPVFHPQPGFSITNTVRGGDTIANLTGVMHWSWAGFGGTDAWRIRPVTELYNYEFTETTPRIEQPATVGGSLKVASFNVLNYFTTLDDGNANCGPDATLGCRGANSAAELTRQTQKIVSAICAIDADIVGLMELENPGAAATQSPIGTLVSAINQSCGVYEAIETGSIGNDAITVGVIYKPATVTQAGAVAILDSQDFVDPNQTGLDKNRPAIAVTFTEQASLEPLTVVVNHLKSKGSSCGAGDDDTTTGQGNCNHTRTLGALAQAAWLANYPTGINTDNVLIIGDLNAYRKEDPIVALQNAGYIDLIDQFNGANGYSYVFDGQLGYLDYGLSSAELTPFITGVTEWHINADEVNLLDYNDTVRDSGEASFEAKPTVLPLFEPNAYRSSDHDPLVIGIEFPKAPQCNDQKATIYVDNGLIVGGDHDGQPYRGVLKGTAQDDVIVGTNGRDYILGLKGNDSICAGDKRDLVVAGPGDDQIFGGAGRDILLGNSGNDTLDGSVGRNLLAGGLGQDTCKNGRAYQCEQ